MRKAGWNASLHYSRVFVSRGERHSSANDPPRRERSVPIGELVNPQAQLENFPSLTWEEAARSASAPIRAALDRVLERQDGACLTDGERYGLARCEGADLLALLVAANDM